MFSCKILVAKKKRHHAVYWCVNSLPAAFLKPTEYQMSPNTSVHLEPLCGLCASRNASCLALFEPPIHVSCTGKPSFSRTASAFRHVSQHPTCECCALPLLHHRNTPSARVYWEFLVLYCCPISLLCSIYGHSK